MDQPCAWPLPNPACEFCKQIKPVYPCEICDSFAFCADCRSNDTDRHAKFCQQLESARLQCKYYENAALLDAEHSNPKAQLFGDSDYDIEWRRTNRNSLFFFEKNYELSTLKLRVFGTTQLPTHVIQDVSQRLALGRDLSSWNHPRLRMMLPANYICDNRDQSAYDFIMWFARNPDNASAHTTGRPSFRDQENRCNDVLQSAAGLGENDAFFRVLRVPLLLIKVRALLDLLKLEGNIGWLESKSLEEKIQFLSPHFSGNIIRYRPDVLQSDRQTIQRHIASLKADVQILGQFPEKENCPTWKIFWKLMLRSGPRIIEEQPGDLPARIRDLITANYYSWLHSPGAIDFMATKGYLIEN